MARSYGALKVSVWEPGSEFRRLSPLAQWSYTMLLSQPQVSNLGVLPYTPEKWARFAAGLTVAHLEQAIGELAAERFVVVDEATTELLVRTFIKHDKVWSQPKLVTNARRLIREVESVPIREYLTSRHPWLLDERGKDEIEAYEAAPDRGIETPSHTPIGRGMQNGAGKGVTEPLPIPISPPRAPAGPGPGSGVGTAAELKEEELELQGSAAAQAAEAPRPSAIATACERFNADATKVEPLAQAMTAELFDATTATVSERCETGQVRNPAGLLIKMLRDALKSQERKRTGTIHILTPGEQVIEDAIGYAKGHHPLEIALELTERKLARLGVAETERATLTEHAMAAYAQVADVTPDDAAATLSDTP